jgi:ribosomal-protein-alanine N-acetyltransferase
MIRAYSESDKPEVIKLLQLNTPEYFDPSEEIEFIDYLDNKIEDYFVVLRKSKIVGAGGINYFPDENMSRISWDMIHPDYQGKGVGKELIQYRIELIKASSKNIELIVVRTSQLTYKFYKKMGFELDKIEKDFWAKGFDLYQMIIKNKVI